MKSKKIIICLLIVGILNAAYTFVWPYFNSYIRVVKVNWGVELPYAESRELCFYSEPSVHGDGIRYHVIDYPVGDETVKAPDVIFELERIFKDASQPTDAQVSHVEQLLNEIDVSEGYLADFGKCQLINLKQEDNSELYMFYWSGTGTVYIVESFI